MRYKLFFLSEKVFDILSNQAMSLRPSCQLGSRDNLWVWLGAGANLWAQLQRTTGIFIGNSKIKIFMVWTSPLGPPRQILVRVRSHMWWWWASGWVECLDPSMTQPLYMYWAKKPDLASSWATRHALSPTSPILILHAWMAQTSVPAPPFSLHSTF